VQACVVALRFSKRSFILQFASNQTSQPTMCNGFTKQGRKCKIVKNLNARGYCQWHDPDATPCLGTTKAGNPCLIRWKLNARGFCRYHQRQAPEVEEPEDSQFQGFIHRCKGTASSTQKRCLKDWEMASKNFCVYHQNQAKQPLAWSKRMSAQAA
jgi:hypothetical protein